MQQRGRLIARILAAILGAVALYIIAKLVWLWVEYLQPKQEALQPVQVVPVASQRPTINVNRLTGMHIFGEANAAPEEPEQIDIQDTTLNLKLLGTYVSTQEENSSAIILANGNQEKAYFIGDKLEVGNNVTLHKVETLKVTIKNGGKYEVLRLLENINQDLIQSSSEESLEEVTDSRVIDKRNDSRLSEDLTQMREKLYSSPLSLEGMASFERVIDDSGMVTGYKVSPGKDPRMFARLGLRRNDVIKAVNGNELNEQGYLGIIEQLNNADSLEITIERNGQPVTLLLGLSQASEHQSPPNPNERQINEPEFK